MSKTIFKKAGICVIALLIVAMSVTSYVSAAEHDRTEDVSSEVATLSVGKELSYVNRQYNPVEKVTYKIEKVRAWHNENENAELNGTPIDVSRMPDPSESEVDIQLAEKSNGSATGKKDVKITFSQAGYYVYKISEYPISVEGAQTVNDKHSYFAVIYVCNKTDESGNTVPGVYVHDITSYRNSIGSEEYVPDLSDIAKKTDNNNEQAKENTEENLGKVGKSSPDTPNVLEAYRMWNNVMYPDPVNLTVTKNVTGSLGDMTKAFIFTVTIRGTEPGVPYNFSGTGEMSGSPSSGSFNDASGSLTSDADGNIEFTYLMKDDQSFTIEDLPKGTEWSVTEGSNNHKASYTVVPEECAVTSEAVNQESDKEITAEGELLENTEAKFVNDRNLIIVTGVNMEPSALAAAAAVFILCAFMVISLSVKARRKHEMED